MTERLVPQRTAERTRDRTVGLTMGVVFVLAGLLFLFDALNVASLRADIVLPLAMVVLGVAVLISAVLGWRRTDQPSDS